MIHHVHLQTAIDALEFQHRQYEDQLRRTPKTRDRKPNLLHAHLVQLLDGIDAARTAIQKELPYSDPEGEVSCLL